MSKMKLKRTMNCIIGVLEMTSKVSKRLKYNSIKHHSQCLNYV